MRVLGKVLASAAAVALIGAMAAVTNAAPSVSGLTADSQISLVAEKKADEKKAVEKKADEKKAVEKKPVKKAKVKKAKPKKAKVKKAKGKKAGKKHVAKKTCGVGKYRKAGKCVSAATNPPKLKKKK